MKKHLAPVLSVLALSFVAACGASAASKAIGTYSLDVDSMIAAMGDQMKGAPPEMVAAMKTKMSGTIDLKADNVVTFSFDMGIPMAPKMNETGTWKIEGTTLTMTSKKDGKDDVKSAKLENGTITIEDDQGGKKMRMVFKKK